MQPDEEADSKDEAECDDESSTRQPASPEDGPEQGAVSLGATPTKLKIKLATKKKPKVRNLFRIMCCLISV